MKRRDALTLTLAALTTASLPVRGRPAPPRWRAETNFTELPQVSAAVTVEPGFIAVDEVFRYSCGACNAFEPELEKWIAVLPKGVAFHRTPVAWTSSQKSEALLALTLRELGHEELHHEVYDSIHRAQRPLSAAIEADSLRLQSRFLLTHGIDPREFERARSSPAVQKAMVLAERLVRDCRVISTPTMVVAGRYTITVGQAGGFSQLLMVTRYLVGREQSRRFIPDVDGQVAEWSNAPA